MGRTVCCDRGGGVGFSQRVGHILFQNVGLGHWNGVTVQRHIDQLVPFFSSSWKPYANEGHTEY